jgi:hypothetical protein
MIHLESITDFLSKHNKMANLLFLSLKDSMESNDIKIKKSGDNKYSLFFRQEYIESYRTPGNSYTLSVNNKMYEVSSFLSKKIWNLLDKSYKSKRFGVEDLEKKFGIGSESEKK